MTVSIFPRSRQVWTCLSGNSRWHQMALCREESSNFRCPARFKLSRMHSTDDTSLKKMSTSTDTPTRVAFVGLGNMGLPMALNMARKLENDTDNIHLTVNDLNEANVTKFFSQSQSGGLHDTNFLSAANDLASVAKSDPDFIVTSLPSCEASEAVVSDLVQKLSPSKECVFIDTSTISTTTSRKLHETVSSTSSQFDYVDAPVSGGVKGATDGTLTFMVGCSSPERFAQVEPFLQRMGKGIIPCGGPGSGSAVKLCNNLALAAQMIGICEAMNLGDSLGVDPTVLAGVMNVSTAKCWSSQVNNPHPAAAKGIGTGASANGYNGGFGTSLMLKDLNLAVDAGEEKGLVMPIGGLSRDLYRMADLHGYGKKDFGVMLQFLRGTGAGVHKP